MTSSTSLQSTQRRLPIGAEIQPAGGVHFRVWAPRRNSVIVELHDVAAGKKLVEVPLVAEGDGYYSAYAPLAAAGTRYGFRLDDDTKLYPDPASRLQPDGPARPVGDRRSGSFVAGTTSNGQAPSCTAR